MNPRRLHLPGKLEILSTRPSEGCQTVGGPFNRLEEEEEEDNRTLTWKNRPVPLTGPCSSGEKGLEGGKNKALSEGGANTWMGGLSSIQQEKRLEEQKVWASLGVPERTT